MARGRHCVLSQLDRDDRDEIDPELNAGFEREEQEFSSDNILMMTA